MSFIVAFLLLVDTTASRATRDAIKNYQQQEANFQNTDQSLTYEDFTNNVDRETRTSVMQGCKDAEGRGRPDVDPHDVIEAELLMDKLFEACGREDQCMRYSKYLAPMENGKAVRVDFETYFIQMVNFDSETQVVSLMMWISVAWWDKRLKWDPCDKTKPGYGVEFLTVDPAMVWTPDLTLYNSADQGQNKLEQDFQVRLRIFPDGKVKWTPLLVYDISCPMRMSYFPFDIQLCYLKWGSWVHTKASLDVNLLKNETDTSYMIDNYIYHFAGSIQLLNELVYTTNVKEEVFQDLKLFFMLERNYKGYIINIVVQCVLLCFLSFLSFWIPVGSGERLDLSLNVIIAISVYQLITTEAIPPGTDNIPLLGWFIFGLIFLVYFSVIVTMINLKVEHSYQMKAPPRWILHGLIVFVGIMNNLDNIFLYKRWKFNQKMREDIEKVEKVALDKIRLATNPRHIKTNNKNDSAAKKRWIKACNEIWKERFDLKKKRVKLDNEKAESAKNNEFRKLNLDQEYELNYEEKFADLEWKLYSLLLDRFCMAVYILIFIGIVIMLAVGWGSHDRQMEVFREEIETKLKSQ